MTLASKKFVSSREAERLRNTLWGRYQAGIRKNSFIYVGLPFFTIMLAGTYLLTQFAAVRYEQFDRKNTEMEEERMLNISNRKRKLDMRDEYYRLQQLDTENWDQKRVTRLPGESQNKW